MKMTNPRQVQRHHQIMIMIWLVCERCFFWGPSKYFQQFQFPHQPLSTVSVENVSTFNSFSWKCFYFQRKLCTWYEGLFWRLWLVEWSACAKISKYINWYKQCSRTDGADKCSGNFLWMSFRQKKSFSLHIKG
jgi:hypothetical protein